MMGEAMMYIVLGVVGIGLIYVISTYNRIQRYKNQVYETYSGIDVALSKRFSLITNLVEVVKGAMKHEQKTLELVTQERAKAMNRVAYDENTQEVVTQLFALSESYPDLKTDTQFLKLQAALVDVEEHLQAARRLYNRNVSELNTLIASFPASAVNGLAKVEPAVFYEADTSERNNVHISFDIKDI